MKRALVLSASALFASVGHAQFECCIGQREDWTARLYVNMDGALLTAGCEFGAPTGTIGSVDARASAKSCVASATECQSLNCAIDGSRSSGLADQLFALVSLGGLDAQWSLKGGGNPPPNDESGLFGLTLDSAQNNVPAFWYRQRRVNNVWAVERYRLSGQYQVDSRRTLNDNEYADLDYFCKMEIVVSAARGQLAEFDCKGAPSLPTIGAQVIACGTYRYKLSWTDNQGSQSNQSEAFVSLWSDGAVLVLGEATDPTYFNIDDDFTNDNLEAELRTEQAPWYRLDLPACGTYIVFDVRVAQGYEPDGNMDADDRIYLRDYNLLANAISGGAVSYTDDTYFLGGDLDADGDMDTNDLTLLDARNCLADFNGDFFVDFFDYSDYVDAYGVGDLSADVNGDGFLDFFDYEEYLIEFESGNPCNC